MDNLAEQKCIKHTSKLIGVISFLDKCGIMRVGGLLANSDFTYGMKYSIILDKHNLLKLIFLNKYIRLHHADLQLLLNSTRDKFWMISCLSMARKGVFFFVCKML